MYKVDKTGAIYERTHCVYYLSFGVNGQGFVGRFTCNTGGLFVKASTYDHHVVEHEVLLYFLL